jgi:uncharacterized protein (DUF1501 family)
MSATTNHRRRLPSPQRRRLLQAMVASGLVASVERKLALAQSAADYKALVCIFQAGGNDGENTLIRYDAAGYQQYAAVRTPASGINIPQAQLVPIQPLDLATPYGFHPACAPLKTLFDQKRLAVLANVGVLAQPSLRAGLESGSTKRPANLFSHSHQELALESGDASGFTRTGWGGRLADRLEASAPQSLFPVLTSIDALKTWTAGATSIPLTVPAGPWFNLFGSNRGDFDALRDAAMREILAVPRANVYDDVAQVLAEEGLAASSVVFPILNNPQSIVAPHFATIDSPVGRQLKSIAMLIEGRAQTGVRRQVFFANQWSYDTHGAQAGLHHTLLDQFSRALAAFDAAMNALGISPQVTTFTLSEFGRTFKPAANAGTDHGWGNYAFVMGGAVKGGQFYGTVPNHALDGPDDLGKDGRWIPTTSVETYGATLVRWLGVAEADLPYIFPNLGAFPVKDLGFLA